MRPINFAKLTDADLIELVRKAMEECATRGDAVEKAIQSATLTVTQRVKIESAASQAEADRLKLEEARKVADETAARVRREAAAKAEREAAEKTKALWDYKDSLATQIGSLIRGDREWKITVWKKGSDKRVYITDTLAEFGVNDVAYFHTGNDRTKPGDLIVDYDAKKAVLYGTSSLESIKEFCVGLCEKWITFEHTTPKTTSSRPAWPTHFRIWDGDTKHPYHVLASGRCGKASDADPSRKWKTREEAEAFLASEEGKKLDAKYRIEERLGDI